MKPKQVEHQIQVAIVQYHDSNVAPDQALLLAIPNGGQRGATSRDLGADATAFDKARARRRRAIAGAKLKKEGARAGASDLVLVLASGRIHWIEVKTPAIPYLKVKAGTLSEDQKAMHAKLAALGHSVTVIRSLDDYLELLRREQVPVRASLGWRDPRSG